VKLDTLIGELSGPSSSIVEWNEQPLSQLQEAFYQQSLPAVKDTIKFSLSTIPYMCRSGVADCYLFYGHPEIAKKNPKKIFLSVEDGGSYERIFSPGMTAEKMIIAHEIKVFVDEFVRTFATIRRKSQASDDLQFVYQPILGADRPHNNSDVIHQVMAPIPKFLKEDGVYLIREHLRYIIDYANSNKDKADKSWPVLLKSNAFFTYITAYLAGKRSGNNTQPPTKSGNVKRGD
jgi:hypothetical protein